MNRRGATRPDRSDPCGRPGPHANIGTALPEYSVWTFAWQWDTVNLSIMDIVLPTKLLLPVPLPPLQTLREKKKKNNINDDHDDCIESKFKCSFFYGRLHFVFVCLFLFHPIVCIFLHSPLMLWIFVLYSILFFLLRRPPCLQRALCSVGRSTLTAKRILYKKKNLNKLKCSEMWIQMSCTEDISALITFPFFLVRILL